MQWYAVQVTTAHEKKVKRYLEKQKNNLLADKIGDIVIPEKDGVPIIPGYVFIQAVQWPESYLISFNTWCNVIGTVTEGELKVLLSQGGGNARPAFKKGDEVVICSGPLSGTKGTIERYGSRRSKISFFGGEVVIDAENRELVLDEKGA